MENTKIVEQPVRLHTLTDKLTDKAIDYIKSASEKPFAIYMSYPNVHVPHITNPRNKGKSNHGHYGDR